MKKVINGKTYNTDTAKKVGSWSSERSYSDFRYCETTLYRKRTGEYFVVSGDFFHDKGDLSTGWGDDILPYSAEKAERWLENPYYVEIGYALIHDKWVLVEFDDGEED